MGNLTPNEEYFFSISEIIGHKDNGNSNIFWAYIEQRNFLHKFVSKIP